MFRQGQNGIATLRLLEQGHGLEPHAQVATQSCFAAIVLGTRVEHADPGARQLGLYGQRKLQAPGILFGAPRTTGGRVTAYGDQHRHIDPLLLLLLL